MKLNANYSKLVINAATKTWVANKSKMQAKGISQDAYTLGYLHGYSACFDVYDLSGQEHPPSK